MAEGVPFKQVAEAISRQIGVPTASLSLNEAKVHFGGLATWVTGAGVALSEKTRAVLGWNPQEIGLLADIDRPEYFA